MKKITSLLMMFMLFVGMGWAQVASVATEVTKPSDLTSGYYVIKNVNQKKFGNQFIYAESVAANGALKFGDLPATTSADINKYIWYVDVNGDLTHVSFSPISKNLYWPQPQWKGNLSLASSKVEFTLQTENQNLGSPSNLPEGKTAALIRNTNLNEGENPIAYLHMNDGQNLGSWKGSGDNTALYAEFYKVNFTAFVPSQLEADGTFGKGMHWYRMNLRFNDTNPFSRPVVNCQLINGSYEIRSQAENNSLKDASILFAFVGNPQEGYQIYNNFAGKNRVLWSNNTNGLVKMLDKQEDSRWMIAVNTKSDNSETGWAFKRKGSDNDYMSRQPHTANIGFWVDASAVRDDHGRFLFEQVPQEELDAILAKVEVTVKHVYNGQSICPDSKVFLTPETALENVDLTQYCTPIVRLGLNQPTITSSTATAQEGTVITATYTVDNAALPFKPSTVTDGKFGEMHWYRWTIHRDTPKSPKYNKTDDLSYNNNATDAATKENMYAFVGNAAQGFQIYNYAAGPNKILWSNNHTTNVSLPMTDKSVANDGKNWILLENGKATVDGAQVTGFVFKKDQVVNGYMNDAGNKLGYWINTNAKGDKGGRFTFKEFTQEEVDALTGKQFAQIPYGYHMIYYTDANGVEHYLQIEKDGTFSVTETPVYSFNMTEGSKIDGNYSTAGVYYLTMNGYRLSRWDASGKFLTNNIETNAQHAEGLWHCQAIKYNPVTDRYAIRSTNVHHSDVNYIDSYITYNNGISQVVSADGSEDNLYQWQIRSGYPFELTLDKSNPVFYGIKSGRGDDYWYTLITDQTGGRIKLQSMTGEASRYWYFMEVKDGIQYFLRLYPGSSNGNVVGYTDTGNGEDQLWIVEDNKVEQDVSWKFNWSLYSPTGGAPYALKAAGTNQFLSNYNGAAHYMGFYNVFDDPGTKIYFTEASLNEEVAPLVADRKELLKQKDAKQNAVGYPVQAEWETLQTAVNGTSIHDLIHVRDFMRLTNVNMPVAGKAYKLHVVTNETTSRKWYMKMDNGTHGTWTSNADQAETFICQEVGDKYMFVNNKGRYLRWYGSNTEMPDAYTAVVCDFNVRKMLKTNTDVAVDNVDKLFGYVTLDAKRGTEADAKDGYFVVGNDGAYSGADKAYFNGSHTSAFVLEEVSYANTPALKPIVGDMVNIADAKNISTFSAPFATVLPENVKAFYLTQEGMKEGYAKLSPVAGSVLPKNTGVILTAGEGVTSATMVPATEAGTELAGNILDHSAGAAKTLNGEFYLLGLSNGKVGFFLGNEGGSLAMNKAYLPISQANPVQGLKLVFGDEVTGIEGVEAEAAAKAPIYDLSGRRVLNTVKGGIYIQNGKKFIVK